MARNPAFDTVFNCLNYDKYGVIGVGILKIYPEITGEFKSITATDCTLDLGGILIEGSIITSTPQSGDALDFSSHIGITGDYIPGTGIFAKIKWSNIGEFNFDIDRKNVAGDMPLGWRGEVYNILKLGSDLMIYGSGGISKITPKENVFSKKTISLLGVVSEWSVVGNDFEHFFIDGKSRLCRVSDRVEILGYEEFLEPMDSPVMVLDEVNRLVFICDGTYGYVYGIDTKSLGSGPVNITGVGYSNFETYVASSNVISMPAFQIVTNVLDCMTRKNKTIHMIEVGTSLGHDLEASIQFNTGINDSFVDIGWHKITPEGTLNLRCFGKEFKIGIRSQANDQFKINWIKITGIIHDFNPLDN